MVPWIKMRTNLRDDPRVRLVSKRIGCNAVSVIGGLYVLWSLADQYSVDGRLSGYDADDLDRMFGKPGFSKALASEDIGWLEVRDDSLLIPRFQEHNGETAKSRSQTSKRVNELRRRNADVTVAPLQNRYQMKRKNKKEESTAANAAAAPTNGKAKTGRTTPIAPHSDSTDLPPSEGKKVAAAPAGDFHAIVAHYRSAWEDRYPGVDFVFAEEGQSGRNGRHFKWILNEVKGDMERAKATVDAYLADGSLNLVENRHPIAWLVSSFNKYQAPKANAVRKPQVLEKARTYNLP